MPSARTFTATGARRDASLTISLATRRRMVDVLDQCADTYGLDYCPLVRLAGLEHGVIQCPQCVHDESLGWVVGQMTYTT